MFVINEHIKKIKKIKIDIENNEFDFEENVCLSNLIVRLAKTKDEIEKTIDLFNNIISYTTILGGISLAIFIKDVFPHGSQNVNFQDHDRYLFHPLILYICNQIIAILRWPFFYFFQKLDLFYI